MNNFKLFLQSINNKTNGMFFIFLVVFISLFLSMSTYLFDYTLFIPKPNETDTVIIYILGFIAHTMLTLFFLIICFTILKICFNIITWIKNDLFKAIKESLEEHYNIKKQIKQSKISFE